MSEKKKPKLTRKQAERQLAAARAAIGFYEDQGERERNAALCGRFFKYRNSYSVPGPDDYWWLYLAVTELDEHGGLAGWSFQTDKDGRMEVQPRARVIGSLMIGGNYIQIERAEFYAAYDQLVQAVKGRLVDEFRRG